MPERDDQAKSNTTQLALNTDLNTKWITIPEAELEIFCQVNTEDHIVFYLPPCDHDFPGVCDESHTWFTVYYPGFIASEEPFIISWVTGYTIDSKLALDCATRTTYKKIRWHVASQNLSAGELEVAKRAIGFADRGWNDKKTCTRGFEKLYAEEIELERSDEAL